MFILTTTTLMSFRRLLFESYKFWQWPSSSSYGNQLLFNNILDLGKCFSSKRVGSSVVEILHLLRKLLKNVSLVRMIRLCLVKVDFHHLFSWLIFLHREKTMKLAIVLSIRGVFFSKSIFLVIFAFPQRL